MSVLPDHVLNTILGEVLGRPQSYLDLGRLCDQVGGRIAGTDAGRQAEEWGLAALRRYGLTGIWEESLDLDVWERGDLSLAVPGAGGWQLIAVAHANGPLAVDLEAAVVDVGHGRATDFASRAADLTGAIALCDETVPPGERNPHRSERLAAAVAHGAGALLILSSASGGLARTGVCHPRLAPIASLGIAREDGLRLRRLLAGGSTPRLKLNMRNRQSKGRGRNILAEIPGRDPDAGWVLAGAHLDSWDLAQGATDNGLGVAIVLEMARALALLPPESRPRAGLRFALWTAEETGLLGSTAYVAGHEAELPRHRAVMNFDMTGDPYGYWLPGQDGPSGMLTRLAEQLAPLGMGASVDLKPGLHSDHQPFMLAGVPIVSLLGRLSSDGARYYHSLGDTFEKVDLPALCRAAAVGAATLWALADEIEPSFAHLSAAAVDAMVDRAGLREALAAL
ncbi:MAG TPA: M28 family peptidase [Anaerolineae bacterium]|nr:M28 family peptidase [Anaerolineae bacterium]